MDGQYDKRKGKKKFFIQCFPALLFFLNCSVEG